MEAGTTSAYRNRKRRLNGRPRNPKVKRRLFPADVPRSNRRAAEMERLLLKRQGRVIAQADGLLDEVAATVRVLVDIGLYSYRELDPLYFSVRSLESAIRACKEAAEAPVEVRPDPYDDGDDDGDDDDETSSSSPPSFVQNGGSGAALVAAATRGDDDTVRGKRRAKANSKYYGPEWTKK